MGFRVQGNIELNGKVNELICILRETGKKEFSIDGETYEKLSEHIGRFPCVMIAPDDIYIITEASEERRRLIDAILSQTDHNYLLFLMDYNRVLQQRNSYLRTIQTGRADQNLLDVYDQQLSRHGSFIHDARKIFLLSFVPMVKKFYAQIAGVEEGIELVYKSQLNTTDPGTLLKESREKDILLQRTTTGIHRDDIEFLLNDRPFKSLASQGQKKSLLFSLKLAEFESLKQNKGFAPVLLLDDVFEKLDESRMHNLLSHVCLQKDVHLFITDTHGERIKMHMQKIGVNCQLVEI